MFGSINGTSGTCSKFFWTPLQFSLHVWLSAADWDVREARAGRGGGGRPWRRRGVQHLLLGLCSSGAHLLVRTATRRPPHQPGFCGRGTPSFAINCPQHNGLRSCEAGYNFGAKEERIMCDCLQCHPFNRYKDNKISLTVSQTQN